MGTVVRTDAGDIKGLPERVHVVWLDLAPRVLSPIENVDREWVLDDEAFAAVRGSTSRI
jgi:hypothetical protein